YGELLDVKENSSELPSDFFVSQNYPNPFNGLTNIDITLNGSAGMEKLIIEIYDILGKKVYEKEYTPFKTFTIRINSDYLILSSGTYIYSILFNNKRISKKFILLK
ncbi:MAG TPA: T9SS type A sorting domain-containing protein, partial [Arachidicoccus soli]|nr:T9SS type A sorting domain-containing protein [Arachidicoccus soli]